MLLAKASPLILICVISQGDSVRVTGLRERQKRDRRQRILAVAREQFVAQGVDSATMESIAAQAGVSAVTLYNYYGAKLGLLLALVAESDHRLIDKVDAFIADPPGSVVDAVAGFAAIVRVHALSFLSKPVWRQVLAASITLGDSEFGRVYARLDRELGRKMTLMLSRLRARRLIGAAGDLDALGDCLFHLQNARFIQFISIDALADARVDAYLRADITALFALAPPLDRSHRP